MGSLVSRRRAEAVAPRLLAAGSADQRELDMRDLRGSGSPERAQEEEEEEEEDLGAMADGTASVASGFASSLPSGIETPSEVDLRKDKAPEPPRQLYTVLEQRAAPGGGGLLAPEHTYAMPGQEGRVSVAAAKRLEALRREVPTDLQVAIDPAVRRGGESSGETVSFGQGRGGRTSLGAGGSGPHGTPRPAGATPEWSTAVDSPRNPRMLRHPPQSGLGKPVGRRAAGAVRGQGGRGQGGQRAGRPVRHGRRQGRRAKAQGRRESGAGHQEVQVLMHEATALHMRLACRCGHVARV